MRWVFFVFVLLVFRGLAMYVIGHSQFDGSTVRCCEFGIKRVCVRSGWVAVEQCLQQRGHVLVNGCGQRPRFLKERAQQPSPHKQRMLQQNGVCKRCFTLRYFTLLHFTSLRFTLLYLYLTLPYGT